MTLLLVYCHFLFDIGVISNAREDDEEADCGVEIYFAGSAKRLRRTFESVAVTEAGERWLLTPGTGTFRPACEH